ncbi:DUF1444 family protein [Candidatus Peribacteria bacterium]|nr:DUF1444 family protein [Candidatus Peribacteria bacterium]
MFKRHRANIGLIAIILLIAGGAVVMLSSGAGSAEWREAKLNIMPQFLPTEKMEKLNVLSTSFSDDVSIGFVLVSGDQYEFIDDNMVKAWEVEADVVEEQAMRNLEARSRNLDVEVAEATDQGPNTKYVIVELDDGFAAVRLLSPGVRRAIARELGDEYIAAIPTRDFLIFWHRQFPLFDAFGKQVEAEYSLEADYPLTPALFFVGKDGIEEMIKKAES